MAYDDGLRAYEVKKPFEGVVPNLERRYKETESDWARDEISRYMSRDALRRLRGPPPQARGARGQDRGLRHRRGDGAVGARPPSAGSASCRRSLSAKQNEIAVRILKEIRDRLTFLVDVGLEYLTLGARLGHAVRRREPAHPPGEPDRLRPHRRALRPRRALDRPAPARQRAPARDAAAPARPRQHGDRRRARRGRDPVRRLRRRRRPRRRHPRRRDRRQGHAPRTSSRTRARSPAATSRASSRCRSRQSAASRAAARKLKLVGARGNNLKDVTAEIPLGLFTCITGVSGGGKSTLVVDTLYKAIAQAPQRRPRAPGAATSASRAWSTSTRSSTSTSRRSGARRARTRRPISAPSRRSANGSPACPRRRRAATGRGASRSTSRAAAARPAPATASSRSRCTSCPTSTSPATSARASATTARRSRCATASSSIADVLDMTVEEAPRPVQGGAGDPREARDAVPRRPRLHPRRPAGDDALRRRGAARQALEGAVETRHRPHALHPRRADHRPALPRREEAPRGAARARRTRATRSW